MAKKSQIDSEALEAPEFDAQEAVNKWFEDHPEFSESDFMYVSSDNKLFMGTLKGENQAFNHSRSAKDGNGQPGTYRKITKSA